MYSRIYTHNGNRWTQQLDSTGTKGGHVEQTAYGKLLDKAPSPSFRKEYKKIWIGFVQNAPPCTEYCRKYFLDLSSTTAGFVFHIIGDHGGYCSAYGISGPVDLYFYKGAVSIGKPAAAKDAPDGPR